MGQAETKPDHPAKFLLIVLAVMVCLLQGRRKWIQKKMKGLTRGLLAGRSETLQLVLVGPKGSGKSSVGNSILGRKAFTTGIRTLTCQAESCRIGVRTVTVVDTPCLTVKEDSNQEVMRVIKKSCQDLLEFPVVFLLVLPLRWNAKKSRDSQHLLRGTLCQVSVDHSMVLITHTDQDKQDIRDKDSVPRKEGLLQTIVDQCGGWFHMFNTAETDHTHISALLEKIDKMILEGRKTQELEVNLEEESRSDEDQTQEQGLNYRAEISHQRKRVQKRVELMKNSERIIAENKELLRELRDQTDTTENQLLLIVSEHEKIMLTEKLQETAADIRAKEEKILLHIRILQTLQQQVEEKRRRIREMEKAMREQEREYMRTKSLHSRTKEVTGDFQSESGTPAGARDTMAGGRSSFAKNFQKLEEQRRSSREEEEDLVIELQNLNQSHERSE